MPTRSQFAAFRPVAFWRLWHARGARRLAVIMMLARRLKEKGGASEKAPLAAGDEARSLQVEGVNVEEHKRLCPNMNDIKWVDQFPYVPSYRFHPYRSCFGATCSVLLGFIFFLRMVSSAMDFVDVPPLVTESRDRVPARLE